MSPQCANGDTRMVRGGEDAGDSERMMRRMKPGM